MYLKIPLELGRDNPTLSPYLDGSRNLDFGITGNIDAAALCNHVLTGATTDLNLIIFADK